MRIANRSILPVVALLGILVLASCQKAAPPAEPAAETPATVTADTSGQPARSTDVPAPEEPMPTAEKPVVEPSAFVDRVWQVSASSSAEPGTTYTFLSGGTLVIDSPNGTPMHGKWSLENGALTMVEEGVSYPTDILALDAGQFRLLSHNPGTPVEISLVPAADQTLPKAKP
ncbi:hypothetical protein [Lysobacter panacisoli]|uniref:Uncharacterized protein n=1 Tax=Lysobacter panacisoli TaxID=1255263 RepID=A0ABP9L321_9GAMM|nr:hypothetical protein [Lysobacter panacisoli]